VASKPSDFFIGVVDFFSIVLPGALLSFLALDFAKERVFGWIMPPIGGGMEGWMAFAVASYLLGHFVSLVGAAFLDKVYDWTYVAYRRRRGDRLYKYVGELKQRSLGDHSNITNVYKWARATVRLQSASATQEIDRLEADSKFFRSMTVVLVIFIAAVARRGTLLVSSVLLLLSFWRFCNLRWKCTGTAYLCVAVMEANPASREKTAGA
jgi:hypothetical protein